MHLPRVPRCVRILAFLPLLALCYVVQFSCSALPKKVLILWEAPERGVVAAESSFVALLSRSGELGRAVVSGIPVPGGTVEDVLQELRRGIDREKPDVVVLQVGVNDARFRDGQPSVSRVDFQRTLRLCVREVKATSATCVLATPHPGRAVDGPPGSSPEGHYDETGGDVTVREYAWIVRNLARVEALPLVDAFKAFEYGETEGRYRVRDFLVDGHHLNSAGHRRLAEVAASTLKEVINGRFKPERLPPSTTRHRFEIPLVDLARDSARQIVVDREENQYLGHPSSVLLEDGRTMLIVYPKGHGRGAIVMKRSTDGGLTWSERLPVPENWATSKETPTIYRVEDAAGRKRLILFSGLYPIRMAVSEDDGLTWSELRPIGDYGGIVAVASVVRLKDGRYMALFHDDGRFLRNSGKRSGKMVVYKILSDDGGLTWSDPVPIASLPYADLCEPGAIRSPDGSEIAVLLRENSRRYNSFIIFSDDEGETWSEPRELPGALTGDRHVAQYLPDGRLFISFRDRTPDAGSPTEGDWAGWIGTYDDLVNGTEGQYRLRLADNLRGWDCCYPTIHLLPDGTVVSITYGHWSRGWPPYILEVRFRPSEVEELARKARAPRVVG